MQVHIPKTVFETAPQTTNADGSIVAVRRLDGTVDTVEKITPQNPNFVPRQAWPGGNIVTSNKDEVR